MLIDNHLLERDGPVFGESGVRVATGDEAWLTATLDAEAALARAEARVGITPADAAEAIQVVCRAERFEAT